MINELDKKDKWNQPKFQKEFGTTEARNPMCRAISGFPVLVHMDDQERI